MLIRIHYRKTAEGRFLSHLDIAHSWERGIKRAGLPLAYSQGFNPHPKITFASALAVGTTSDGEYLDMELTEDLEVSLVQEKLEKALAPAFQIVRLKKMEGKQDALMSLVNFAEYRLLVETTEETSQEKLEAVIAEIFKREEVNILRFKKNSQEKRTVNIRPGIHAIKAQADGQKVVIELGIQTGSEFNVRPEEVIYGMMACGLPPVQHILRIHRQGLWIIGKDGSKITPLEWSKA